MYPNTSGELDSQTSLRGNFLKVCEMEVISLAIRSLLLNKIFSSLRAFVAVAEDTSFKTLKLVLSVRI